jgi:heme/copper-type cytochrome/quinol oxidase subunit 2
MDKRHFLKIKITLVMGCLALLTFPASALAAPLAHEAPAGSEWIMADWMFLTFVIFAGVSFLLFLLVLKAGLLSNLEDAKYPILEIDEPDYYTPDWAKEDSGGEE